MDILGTAEGLALPWAGQSFAWLHGDGWHNATMEQFRKSAFDDFLKTHSTVEARISHKNCLGLARVWASDKGLMCSIGIPDNSLGVETRSRIEKGELCGFSIAFDDPEWRWIDAGRSDSSKIKLITRAALREISLCARPAYHQTQRFFSWKPARQSVAATAATPRPATRRDPDNFEYTTKYPFDLDRATPEQVRRFGRQKEARRMDVLYHLAKLNLDPQYAATHSVSPFGTGWASENARLRLELNEIAL